MGPEGVPVFIDVNGPQAHHTLGSLDGPAHPRELQSVIDEIPACPFNNATADGVSFRQTDLVAHVLAVSFEISDDLFEAMLLGSGKVLFGEHLFQTSYHSARFSVEKHPQSFGHEFPGLGTTLVIKAKRGFAQVLQDVKDVQYEKDRGEICVDQCPERTLSVKETDQLVTFRQPLIDRFLEAGNGSFRTLREAAPRKFVPRFGFGI